MVYSDKKIIEGKEIYLYIAFSMQKDHVKCTETPNICFELWLSCCESRIFNLLNHLQNNATFYQYLQYFDLFIKCCVKRVNHWKS